LGTAESLHLDLGSWDEGLRDVRAGKSRANVLTSAVMALRLVWSRLQTGLKINPSTFTLLGGASV